MSSPKPNPKRYLLPGGEYCDLTRATAFVRFQGKYYAIPDCVISQARPQAELDSHYSDPILDGIRHPEVVGEIGDNPGEDGSLPIRRSGY